MKTKIIYISGSEVFDMADIRAAFDEVRTALGLKDTILFGVPVDADDALAAPSIASAPEMVADIPATDNMVEENTIAEPAATAAEEVVAITVEEHPVPVEDTPIQEIEPAQAEEVAPAVPVKKSRGRPRKAAAAEAEKAPAADVAPTPAPVEEAIEEAPAKVIPILSVLASKPAIAEAAPIEETTEPVAEEIVEDEIIEEAAEEIVEVAEEAPLDAEIAEEEYIADDIVDTPENDIIANVADIPAADEITAVSIDDMIDEDAPVAVAEEEKTLEQLLESMTPLREDHVIEPAIVEEAPAPIADDTDATLAQLANEFAENQDKIISPAQNETHGKIGKLKNILPFKKAKRDDSGLMGDLFGWAGIAANDEDFAIPGFFTTAASKK